MLLDAYPPPSAAVALSPSDLTDFSSHSPTMSPEGNVHFALGPAAPNTPSNGTRKRLRSLRSNNTLRADINMVGSGGDQTNGSLAHVNHLASSSVDSVMDFEDEGRERKRPARR